MKLDLFNNLFLQDWQKERLQVIDKILPQLGDQYVLKGGTALIFFYGLARISEDIDLDAHQGHVGPGKKLVSLCQENGWELSIKKQTPTVERVMINYGGKNDKGDYPLKIETSFRKVGLIKKNSFCKRNNVNVYTANSIANMKAFAFGRRDTARDVFDIGFLLEHYPNVFTLDHLNSLYDAMTYKPAEDLAILLEYENDMNKTFLDPEFDAFQYMANLEKNILKVKRRLQG